MSKKNLIGSDVSMDDSLLSYLPAELELGKQVKRFRC